MAESKMKIIEGYRVRPEDEPKFEKVKKVEAEARKERAKRRAARTRAAAKGATPQNKQVSPQSGKESGKTPASEKTGTGKTPESDTGK